MTPDSDDIRLAFAHPEARSAGLPGPDPFDRISLRDHMVQADIGAFQQERGAPQRLRFNVVVEVRPDTGPLNDDVDRILSYDRIAQAIAAELASARLTAFGQGAPVVLTLGPPDLPRPVTGHGPTQRRIDLLAIEQNAWVLAARDARCVVVETRTEIDWAMRQHRMVVWAPSKLVLDAVDQPPSRAPVALALWLAEMLGARGLVVHGHVTPPAGSRVPVTRA